MKKYYLIILFPFLLSCSAVGQHFQYMAECNQEVAGAYPPKYVQQYVQTNTKCSTDITSFDNTRNCTSNPVYKNVDMNEAARLDARNECIARKKASDANSYSSYTTQKPSVSYIPPPTYSGKKMTIDEAIKQCISEGYKGGTTSYGECLRKYTQE